MSGVKGRRFIVLFKQNSIRSFMKMSVWSLTRQQRAFKRQWQTFLGVLPTRWRRKPAGTDMDRNYVTVTLCICCRRPCPSVCPSQAGVVSKRPDESSWFLEWRPPSAYPTLSYKELWVSPKTKVLPSGTLSQTRDFEDFATASRSCCRQNSSSSSSTVELVDDTYATIDESRLFTTSRSTAM